MINRHFEFDIEHFDFHDVFVEDIDVPLLKIKMSS